MKVLSKFLSSIILSAVLFLNFSGLVYAETPAFTFKVQGIPSGQYTLNLQQGTGISETAYIKNWDENMYILLELESASSNVDGSTPMPPEWVSFSEQYIVIPPTETYYVDYDVFVGESVIPGPYDGWVRAKLLGYAETPEDLVDYGGNVYIAIGRTLTVNVLEYVVTPEYSLETFNGVDPSFQLMQGESGADTVDIVNNDDTRHIRIDSEVVEYTDGATVMPIEWVYLDDSSLDVAPDTTEALGYGFNVPVDATPGDYQFGIQTTLGDYSEDPADLGGTIPAEEATEYTQIVNVTIEEIPLPGLEYSVYAPDTSFTITQGENDSGSIYMTNEDDVRHVRFDVEAITHNEGANDMPLDWVNLNDVSLNAAPNQEVSDLYELSVPIDAVPGDYQFGINVSMGDASEEPNDLGGTLSEDEAPPAIMELINVTVEEVPVLYAPEYSLEIPAGEYVDYTVFQGEGDLGDLDITNNDDTRHIRVDSEVVEYSGGGNMPMPTDWVNLNDLSLYVAPADTEQLGYNFDVPVDAEPGDYQFAIQTTLGDYSEDPGDLDGTISAEEMTQFTQVVNVTVEQLPVPDFDVGSLDGSNPVHTLLQGGVLDTSLQIANLDDSRAIGVNVQPIAYSEGGATPLPMEWLDWWGNTAQIQPGETFDYWYNFSLPTEAEPGNYQFAFKGTLYNYANNIEDLDGTPALVDPPEVIQIVNLLIEELPPVPAPEYSLETSNGLDPSFQLMQGEGGADTLDIVNNDDTRYIRVDAEVISYSEGDTPMPTSWVNLDDSSLYVAPGDSESLGYNFTVPVDASPGDYQFGIRTTLGDYSEAGGDLNGGIPAEEATQYVQLVNVSVTEIPLPGLEYTVFVPTTSYSIMQGEGDLGTMFLENSDEVRHVRFDLDKVSYNDGMNDMPLNWVSLDSESVNAAPGEEVPVVYELAIPVDAAPGDYQFGIKVAMGDVSKDPNDLNGTLPEDEAPPEHVELMTVTVTELPPVPAPEFDLGPANGSNPSHTILQGGTDMDGNLEITNLDDSRYMSVHVVPMAYAENSITPMPLGWVGWWDTDLELAPGQTISIPYGINVPLDAELGDYQFAFKGTLKKYADDAVELDGVDELVGGMEVLQLVNLTVEELPPSGPPEFVMGTEDIKFTAYKGHTKVVAMDVANLDDSRYLKLDLSKMVYADDNLPMPLSWVEYEMDNIVVAPGEVESFLYSVAVPEDTVIGDYQFALKGTLNAYAESVDGLDVPGEEVVEIVAPITVTVKNYPIFIGPPNYDYTDLQIQRIDPELLKLTSPEEELQEKLKRWKEYMDSLNDEGDDEEDPDCPDGEDCAEEPAPEESGSGGGGDSGSASAIISRTTIVEKSAEAEEEPQPVYTKASVIDSVKIRRISEEKEEEEVVKKAQEPAVKITKIRRF